ncbi:MAG: CdaR family protein [Candidatus Dormibacteria bacterium]
MSWIANNFRLKLMALLLSMLGWGVVVYAGNPPLVQTEHSIGVDHGAAPPGLVLLQELPAVNVTISGLRSNVNAFKRESLHATADISAAHIGHNTLRVQVTNADPTVTVRDVSPPVIDAELDRVGQVQRRVDPRQVGALDSCCVAGTPTVTPETVTLRGPESLLSSAVAFVSIDVAGRQSDVPPTTVTVHLETPDHRSVAQVSADPTQVSISLPIHPTKAQRQVAIQADVVGNPAPGFRVADIAINPTTILLEGDPSAISQLKTPVITETISIDGRTADLVANNVRLKLPSGITVVGGVSISVRVAIQQEPRVQVTPSVAPPSPSPAASPQPSPSPSPGHGP